MQIKLLKYIHYIVIIIKNDKMYGPFHVDIRYQPVEFYGTFQTKLQIVGY